MKYLSKQLGADSAWAFSAKVGTGVAQILVGAVLARILTPDEFGEFQVVQRIIMLGSVVGSLGMGWVAVRLIAEGLARGLPIQSYYAAKKIFLLVALFSTLLTSLFFIFGSNIVQNAFNISIIGVTLVISLSLFIAAFQQLIPECFRGLHDIKYASLFSGLMVNALFLAGLSLIWLAYNKSDFSYVVQLYFWVSLFVIIVSGGILYYKFSHLNITQQAKQESYSTIIKISFPIFISSILFFIINQADIWIVAAYISTEVAAIYAAASRLVFVLTVPLMVAIAVIKPIVSTYWVQEEKVALEQLLRKVANITLLVSIIPALILIYWGDWILAQLFGDFYSQGSTVMSVLVIGQLLVLASGPCSVLIVMANRQKILLLSAALGVIIFIIASLMLVSTYHELGIAASVVLGMATTQSILVYDSWNKLGIKTFIG